MYDVRWQLSFKTEKTSQVKGGLWLLKNVHAVQKSSHSVTLACYPGEKPGPNTVNHYTFARKSYCQNAIQIS